MSKLVSIVMFVIVGLILLLWQTGAVKDSKNIQDTNVKSTVIEQKFFQDENVEALRIDPEIRYGKLNNGMTYYLRHNENPKHKAELFLVQNTGSLQEENSQQGYTLLLERMAMKGSKNFPSKKGIQEYAERNGMRIGANIIALTDLDETIFLISNVPVNQPKIVDSCLLILHDWSAFLLFDEGEIKKEQDLMRKEWMDDINPQLRLYEQQLPKMYPNSKYGISLPTSNAEFINKFTKKSLEDFYKSWYRPDLQALVIIGDIDVEIIEGQLKRMFADIPIPINPKPKDFYSVPNNDKPIISIAKDKQIPDMFLNIYYKYDNLPQKLKGTGAELIANFTSNVVSYVLSERFSIITQKPNPPFVHASANDGNYFIAKTKGALSTAAIIKPEKLKNAIQCLVVEVERLRKIGVTNSEYERAKEYLLQAYEKLYNERNNVKNINYGQKYIDHFTNGNSITSIEEEYELMKGIASNFALDEINNYVQQILINVDKQQNIVISLIAPQDEEIICPTEDELLALYMEANKEKSEMVGGVNEILIPKLPPCGKIISERKEILFGTTNYKLSNGVTVIVKQMDTEGDILLNAISPGGKSMFKEEKDIWNLKVLNEVVKIGGLGSFNFLKIKRIIDDKSITCQAALSNAVEIVTGSAKPSDLKTLFELIYLNFTDIRKDVEVFQAYKHGRIRELKNEEIIPSAIFNNTKLNLLYDGNPREIQLKESDFDKIDYQRILEMYKERFADASDFVFTIVGNVSIEVLKPLLEQYIASLPAFKRVDVPDENQVAPYHKGKIKKHFQLKMETPKATISLLYTGKMPYNAKNLMIAQVLNFILDYEYMEKIKDAKGEPYNVATKLNLFDFPKDRVVLEIFLETNPNHYNRALEVLKSEIEKIAKSGPTERYFQKSVADVSRGKIDNDYWLNILSTYYFRNLDLHTNFLEVLSKIKMNDIQQFMKELLIQGNEMEIVMYPED